MYYTGFADEAGKDFDVQIKATKELGWTNIETRALMSGNLASITDEEFDSVCAKLDEAGIKFNCFGSGVGNWATSMTEPPDASYEEMRKAIPRMRELGIKLARVMSFPLKDTSRFEEFAEEAIKRMKTIAKIAEDGGIIACVENCSGWATGSPDHMIRVMEAVDSPAMKVVFDTGNPVFDPDVRTPQPHKMQDSWEFYEAVKPWIEYVHIKDGYLDGEKTVFTFPGEGQGHVRKIVADLFKNGYDGGISIEPHMAVVFHDDSVKSEADIQYSNYVEYGKRFIKMVDEIKAEL
ncbi:MAG: sugar phosphate isomerase/epimerase [Kiritimatiellaeota bacterium]|nr:sugar phosphate isomerase/epimerase [Kiritimatiellota bacterium]